MDVVALGTGSADGWPNPFCACASCSSERAAGRLRGQTSMLVDGRLLLDCGPETPRAAERAGVDLTGLRHVLITHQHPDHCSPAFLLFRSWAATGPLDVVGPPDVVDACRMWVAPDSPVRFVAVSPGDRLRLGEYDVRVLAARHGAAGTAVLYDVTSASARLLYATDTAALPQETVDAVRDAAFDVVLMEETFGDKVDHGTDHLDLQTFAAQVRRLREAGAVTGGTDLVAVHLSHHNPPTDELSRRLADWGARVVDDGASLTRPMAVEPRAMVEPAPEVAPVEARRAAPRRTLVIGGARSGKSREAERLLARRARRDLRRHVVPGRHRRRVGRAGTPPPGRTPFRVAHRGDSRPQRSARRRGRAAAGRLPHALADPRDGPPRRLGRRRMGRPCREGRRGRHRRARARLAAHPSSRRGGHQRGGAGGRAGDRRPDAGSAT